MKKWIAKLDISFTVDEEKIKNNKYISIYFIDPLNPTDKEIKAYFKNIIDNYVEVYPGAKILANADMNIICINE